jgi:hypothetical protein
LVAWGKTGVQFLEIKASLKEPNKLFVNQINAGWLKKSSPIAPLKKLKLLGPRNRGLVSPEHGGGGVGAKVHVKV